MCEVPVIHIASFSVNEKEVDALCLSIKKMFCSVLEDKQNVYIYFSDKRQLENGLNFEASLRKLGIQNADDVLKKLKSDQQAEFTFGGKKIFLNKLPYQKQLDSFYDPNCKIIIVPFLGKDDLEKLQNIRTKMNCAVYALYCGSELPAQKIECTLDPYI